MVRDPETGASNGYALVELSSAKEAGVLLKLLSSSSLEVDGKVLIVNYAKNNFNTAYVSFVCLCICFLLSIFSLISILVNNLK